MRKELDPLLDKGRIREGQYASEPSWGHTGAFRITGPVRRDLLVISSTGEDWREAGLSGEAWEHVSVSVAGRRVTPTWEEMSFIKDLFWEEEELVLQFHPPRSVYVNHHAGCLHLWRPAITIIPLPPPLCVGPHHGSRRS